jgi:hypothetical protein
VFIVVAAKRCAVIVVRGLIRILSILLRNIIFTLS